VVLGRLRFLIIVIFAAMLPSLSVSCFLDHSSSSPFVSCIILYTRDIVISINIFCKADYYIALHYNRQRNTSPEAIAQRPPSKNRHSVS
jgi:hypothetical protein